MRQQAARGRRARHYCVRLFIVTVLTDGRHRRAPIGGSDRRGGNQDGRPTSYRYRRLAASVSASASLNTIRSTNLVTKRAADTTISGREVQPISLRWLEPSGMELLEVHRLRSFHRGLVSEPPPVTQRLSRRPRSVADMFSAAAAPRLRTRSGMSTVSACEKRARVTHHSKWPPRRNNRRKSVICSNTGPACRRT